MTKTTNYSLPQWETHDALKRSDFNEANAAVDGALAAKAEKSAVTAVETALANYKTTNDAAMAKKADASALTAYQTSNDAAVAKKAETSALTALQNSLNATNSSVSALSAALGSGGSNCRIATGSYTGTGTYGVTNAITLNFGFKPLVVAVGCDLCATSDTNPSILLRGRTTAPSNWGASSGASSLMQLTWTDTGVSFYNEKYEGHQNNEPDEVYYWVAVGVSD